MSQINPGDELEPTAGLVTGLALFLLSAAVGTSHAKREFPRPGSSPG